MRAINDRVIVKILSNEKVTKGGLILPDISEKRDSLGEVVAVGPEVRELKAGDKVLYNNYSEMIELAGIRYRVVKEENVLAKVDGSFFLEDKSSGGKVAWEDLD